MKNMGCFFVAAVQVCGITEETPLFLKNPQPDPTH